MREANCARIGFIVTDGSLCFVPASISGVGVDHPFRIRCESIVKHKLKTVVIIVRGFVGSVAEKACRDVILANAVGHARKDSVLSALLPIDAPVELVVGRRTAALRVIVVYVVCASAGTVGQGI